MNKTDLRKMVREEIRREFNQILPELIRESIGTVLAKEMRRAKATARPAARRPMPNTGKRTEPLDRTKLAEMIGYGGMSPNGESAPTPPAKTIAGVPMAGGLSDHERSAGVFHMRDYENSMNVPPGAPQPTQPALPPDAGQIEEAYEPQFMSALPGGVDGGAEVPAALVAALGKKSQKVLQEATYKTNWRPGMKRNG